MDLPSDLIDLLAEFDAAGVEYLLVGALALALHGRPRFTKDADLWLRNTEANLERAEAALRRFGAPEATIAALGPAADLDVVWMGHPPARIDLMKGVPGGDFDAVWSRRERIACRGSTVLVVSRADLVALKRASGRAQDMVDAAALEADDG
jgi:hypothetical protein